MMLLRNALAMVRTDRKTGQVYDPSKAFDEILQANKDVLVRMKNNDVKGWPSAAEMVKRIKANTY